MYNVYIYIYICMYIYIYIYTLLGYIYIYIYRRYHTITDVFYNSIASNKALIR